MTQEAVSSISEDPLISRLLLARRESATAGNRRSLFLSMDQLLADVAEGDRGGGGGHHCAAKPDASLRLARMRLRNWKAFERADIIFPPPVAGKSMVVVRGANGFGKSSILEAYALALFGERAFSEIGFLTSVGGRRGDRRRSYRATIERGLHRSVRAKGDGTSSVILDFESDREHLSIERKWYFDEAGNFIDTDEELLLRVGDERRPVEAPAGVDRDIWYQAEIERLVMPADLAPFFLFDGEQVERWAERQLSEQVRSALMQMLGLVELGDLLLDLRDFAKDRERGSSNSEAGDIQPLTETIEAMEASIAVEQARFTEVEAEIEALSAEREASLRTLSEIGDLTHADLQALLENQHGLEAERKRLRRDLVNAIVDDGPSVLATQALLQRVKAHIEADAANDTLSLQPGEIDTIWARFLALEPAINRDEAVALRARFTEACIGPLTETRAATRHPHLDRQMRHAIVDRVSQVAHRGTTRIAAAKEALGATTMKLEQSAAAAGQYGRNLEKIAALRTRLDDIKRLLQARSDAKGEAARAIDAIRQELAPRQARLDALRAAFVETEPRLRAAQAARSLATQIEERIDAAADAEHARFAVAVTDCFRALAHKDQIARIEILSSGALRLLDHEQRDVTDYKLSAGENQLFAMALIAAVGSLLGDRLPLLVDTPLGRLDTQHRQTVLDMLASRSSQTILLTQPEEMGLAQLEHIKSRLAGMIELGHATNADGVGVSVILGDYDEIAA